MKHSLKKLLVVAVVLFFLIIMLIVSARAISSVVASGHCGGEGGGTNLTWVLTEDGVLTIFGEGAMKNYTSSESSPWHLQGSIKTVVIEDGVTTIGKMAFYDCSNLAEVTIPNSVTTIGDYAFAFCTSLKQIHFGYNAPKTFGKNTFYNNSTRVYYPADNETWTETVKQNYGGTITWKSYPSGSCGGEGDGSNLTWALTEDGTLIIFGGGAMADWEYSNHVPWHSYRGDINVVVIPSSVTSIGSNAFLYCDALPSVTIPDSVTSIGDNAFMECTRLTSVTIPASVTSIGLRVFTYCDNLTSITVDGNNPNYSSDSFGVLFNKDKTALIEAPGAISGAYAIPDSVATVGDSAFYGCDNLTSVTIPNSVTTIGESAFAHCKSFTSVAIPDSITLISDWAFYDCYNLTSVTIPNSVTAIGASTFSSCDSLTSVAIPNSVTVIGNWAFNGCDNLTEMTIPDSVTSIGEYTFYHCGALASVTIPDSVTAIGESAFRECDSLTEVTIPSLVTEIGDSAFAYCNALKKIYFKGDTPALGDEVFCDVAATAYYPVRNGTWTEDVMQGYGGTITWEPIGGAVIQCDDCTANETTVTILYEPDAVDTVTAFLVIYDTEGRFLRTEIVTVQDNADGIITISISYTEEEYAEIGHISAFVVDGDTMVPLCANWDSSSV